MLLLTVQMRCFFCGSFCDLCFLFGMFSGLFIAALWSLAGKRLTPWPLVCDVLLCVYHFPMWFPGLDVLLDCIDS